MEVFNIIGALFLCISFLGTYNTKWVTANRIRVLAFAKYALAYVPWISPTCACSVHLQHRGHISPVPHVCHCPLLCFCSGVLPVLGNDRPVFYRERAAGMYNAYVYAATWVSVPCWLLVGLSGCCPPTCVECSLVRGRGAFCRITHSIPWSCLSAGAC